MFLLLASGCEVEPVATESSQSQPPGLELADVVRVVDGDTIIARVDGREERVRYIGIDAPESVTPDRPVECFGDEASDANARLLEGKTVYFEADVEDRDRFGRLLRYVYVDLGDGTLLFINLALVEGGYAEAGFFPPNERYSDDLFDAERTAQRASAGLWGTC